MDDLKFAPERLTTDPSAGLQQFTRLFVGDEQVLARWAGQSGEFGQFMTARLMRNLDTMRALAQCRGPAEFIELQLRWTRDTWDDYVAEAHRLMTEGLVAGQSGTVVAKPVAPKAGARPGA